MTFDEFLTDTEREWFTKTRGGNVNEATLDKNGKPHGLDLQKIKTELAKKDAKVPVQLVPPALTTGAARAFAEGAAKYGPFSWRNPEVKIAATTYAAAIMRHLLAFIDGEDVDPDSTTGKLHVEGIAACIGILLDCIQSGTLIDDRVPGPAPKTLRSSK